MKDGEHDIARIQVQKLDDLFVIMCSCGWKTEPCGRVIEAAEEWHTYRAKTRAA